MIVSITHNSIKNVVSTRELGAQVFIMNYYILHSLRNEDPVTISLSDQVKIIL